MALCGGQLSVLLLNVAAMVEGVDEALLPAVYAEMSSDFGVGLAALGSLTFIRSLVQALGAPFAAYWALSHNRVHIVGAGVVCWAIATAFVAVSTSYWQALLARSVNGIGLAVVGPALMSLVADMSKDEGRGVAFGWLLGAGQFGTVLGGVFATHMGPHKVMGIAGWRAAFLIVAFISMLLGIAIFTLAYDPRAPRGYEPVGDDADAKDMETDGAASNVQEFLQGAKLVLKVKSFQIIVAQGIVGSMPRNALVFLTLWMELIGFSHSASALMVALIAVGSAVGSLFGGWVGDKAAGWSPNKGRILCSQFSAALAIGFAAVLLLAYPKDTDFLILYGVTIFFLGFLMAWGFPATDGPIFAEIVPEELRTTVYAVDLAFEKSLAASGAPLVGLLAEHLFGFRTLDPNASVGKDISNAKALSKALFTCVAAPLSLCMKILTLLYFTYPKDRQQARSVKALANEIRALEMGEHWEGDEEVEDKVWDDGWDSLDDEELDLALLMEREGLNEPKANVNT
ncbi:unnamed protein product [Calypogeia fissa]